MFYQNCSTGADFGIFSVVASQWCFVLYALYFSCRALCGGGNNGSGKKKSDDLTEKKPDEISKLDVKFFSFTTFYYMVLFSSDINFQ